MSWIGQRGPRVRLLAGAMALGFGVFLLAVICLNAPAPGGRALPIWLANALTLTVLLRSRPGNWTLIAAAFAGDLGANLLYGQGLGLASGVAAANTIEAVLAARIVRWGRDEPDLEQPRQLARFVAAAFVASAVSAVLYAILVSGLEARKLAAEFVGWALSDTLGILIVTPCLLTFSHLRAKLKETPFTRRSLVALLVLLAVASWVFTQSRYPLQFLVLPAILWPVLELGSVGGAIGIVLVGALAVGGMALGLGPTALIRQGDMFDRAILLQVFLAVAVLKSLIVASILTQRRALRRGLDAALKVAQEHARRADMAETVAKVGHWSLDAVTREMTWSPEIYRMFHQPPEAGADFEAAVRMTHPDDRERSAALIARALETGEGWENSVSRIRGPYGETSYVVGRAICEKDADGRVTGVFGTLADITEQKLAEAALAESEARYRLITENANDIIVQVGMDGAVSYVSPSVATVTGYSPKELLGRRWETLIHPDDMKQIRPRADVGFRDPHAYAPNWIEYRLLTKDGGAVWVEARPKFQFDPKTGQALGASDVIRDITRRRALEAELEQARDIAEAAAGVKTEFMANMSHELRTPITAVLGFSNLLMEQPGLNEQSKHYVRRVVSASKALLSTVNDILDFSKLEAGQVQIKPKPELASAVVRDAVEIFVAQAAEKGLSLDLDLGLPADAWLAIDADRLRQILLNLIGNAMKFTEHGGVRVECDYAADQRKLSFKVIDTGPGLSPEGTQRLFQRFSQVDGSSTRTHGGTGLGLAICRGLVEAMGGAIGVESTEGTGSCFWFWIAADAVDPAQAESGALQASPAALRCRVLVADDNAANRELVRCWLEPLGVDIEEAVDGVDAVRLAQEIAFDAILMDVRMPRLDGIGALRQIRGQDGRNRETPILAFSADVGPSGATDFLALGFNGQVGKPLVAEHLLEALSACLDQPHAAPEPQALVQ